MLAVRLLTFLRKMKSFNKLHNDLFYIY